jgi:hypothetical protein
MSNQTATSEEISEACGRFYVGLCQCRNECSTHPDASNPADYCGECGKVTCPDCRHIDDRARRCFTCVPVSA